MNKLDLIFVIDDDPIHQQITQIMLDRLQVTRAVARFSDAQDAIDHIRKHHGNEQELPDVILLDLNMPVMDGWEFLDIYSKLRGTLVKEVDVYVLTSSIDEKDRQRVGNFPFVKGYLTKPLTNDTILGLVR